MQKWYVASIILLLAAVSLPAQVLYVKQGGLGNGSSWENAMGDLQQALRVARKGQQVWVARGTYYPTRTGDRSASFRIPSGVAVYGGFEGHENALSQRNWHHNRTILSGEIGAALLEDNSYTIVYFKGASLQTRLDGFTLTGAMANGQREGVNPERCGGAIFNDGAHGISSPTIENCLFIKNNARDGAAIFNYSFKGRTQPLIRHCQFVVNKASLDGGAITNDGSWGISKPRILNSEFWGNEAVYGACILNRAEEGEAVPVISHCHFVANISYVRGSSIYNARKRNGQASSIISGCRFEDNKASISGDVSGSSTQRTGAIPGSEKRERIIFRSTGASIGASIGTGAR